MRASLAKACWGFSRLPTAATDAGRHAVLSGAEVSASFILDFIESIQRALSPSAVRAHALAQIAVPFVRRPAVVTSREARR